MTTEKTRMTGDERDEKTCLLSLIQQKSNKKIKETMIVIKIGIRNYDSVLWGSAFLAHGRPNALENTGSASDFQNSCCNAGNRFIGTFQHCTGIFAALKITKHVLSPCSFPSFLVFCFVTTVQGRVSNHGLRCKYESLRCPYLPLKFVSMILGHHVYICSYKL